MYVSFGIFTEFRTLVKVHKERYLTGEGVEKSGRDSKGGIME